MIAQLALHGSALAAFGRDDIRAQASNLWTRHSRRAACVDRACERAL